MKRKLGPLPLWAVLAAAAVLGVVLYRRAREARETPPGAAGGAVGAAPYAPPAGFTGTATGMLPGPLDQSGAPIGFSVPHPVYHAPSIPDEIGAVSALVAGLEGLRLPPPRRRRRGGH